MKSTTNSSSALKLVNPSYPVKGNTIKIKTSKTMVHSNEPNAVDSAALYVKVKKSAFLSARQNLRKNASILRSAATLLQFAGIVGEAVFLAAGALLYGFLLYVEQTSAFIAVAASIGVGIAGLVFGLVCVSFGTCLCGVAESFTAETKKLFPKN